MFQFFKIYLRPVLRPILRPVMRVVVGIFALRMFRFFLRRVLRLQDLDAEMEKDFEQWFRCSLILLVSTAFMENSLFDWVDEVWAWVWFDGASTGGPDIAGESDIDLGKLGPWVAGFRIMLAIGVIEAMPDQELFAIVHPGPKFDYERKRPLWEQIREQAWPWLKGAACQHLSRSSPVFAILAAVFPGRVGVICYLIAIAQYLVIGLVTSREKALGVLGEFDRQVAIRRREIVDEFQLGTSDDSETASPEPETAQTADGTGAASVPKPAAPIAPTEAPLTDAKS